MEQEWIECSKCGQIHGIEPFIEKNTETQVESIGFHCANGCGVFARIILPNGFEASIEYVSEKEELE